MMIDMGRTDLLAGVDRAEEYEAFSGESVLRDLAEVEVADASQARLILIRFLAAQYLTNRLRGDWPSHLLRLQRSAALNAFAGALQFDRELRALRSTLQRCDGEWPRDALAALSAAASAAAARGHGFGALALRQIGYEAAMARHWWDEAAVAAAGVAQLASLHGTDRMRRRWRRRARVLARRARAAAAAEAAQP